MPGVIPLIPKPTRHGVAYVCKGRHLNGKEARFIFRRSYDKHWLDQHKPTAIASAAPQCTCLPRNSALAYEAGVFASVDRPTLVEVRLGEPTNLIHYGVRAHQTGLGCRCGVTQTDAVPDDLPQICTRDGHAAANPDWTEIDRIEATRRLDTYLGLTTRKDDH